MRDNIECGIAMASVRRSINLVKKYTGLQRLLKFSENFIPFLMSRILNTHQLGIKTKFLTQLHLNFGLL
jgi:hypothetical protein